MKIKVNDIVSLVGLIIIYLLFNILLFSGFFSITEGWFQDYSRYIEQGGFPYKDFYCHIGPVYVCLFTLVCRLCGYSFFIIRIFGIIERVIILAFIYLISRRVFDRIISFVSVLTGAVIYTSNFQDIFYGYYQTSFLFVILSLFLFIKCYDNFNSEKKCFFYSIIFGLNCGLTFLIKQNTGFIFAFVMGLLFLVINGKENIKRSLCLMLTSFLCALVESVVVFLILAFNGALIPFFEQIINGASSKGSIYTIFFGRIPQMVSGDVLWFVAYGLFFFLIFLICNRRKENSIFKTINYVFSVLAVIFIIAIAHLYFFKFFFIDTKSSIAIIISLLILLFFLYVIRYAKKYNELIFYFINIIFFIIYFFYIISVNSLKINYLAIHEKRQVLLFSLFFLNTFVIFWLFLRKKNETSELRKILYVASLLLMYIHSMSGVLEDHGCWLIITLVIGEALSVKSFCYEIKNIFIYIMSVLIVLSVFIQKADYPYHWWGVNDVASIYSAKFNYKDPLLKGLKGSKSSTEVINEIYDTLNYEKSEGDSLFCFPHINYFNVSQNMNSPTLAKVHYFDVCSDKTAVNDALILSKNPPDFIIWMDMSEDEWIFHEEYFRSGEKSGQRELKKWYNTVTESGEYVLLGKYNIDYSDPIYVWMRDE